MKKNLFLTLWLMAPIAVVVLLCVWIFSSFQTGPQMNPQAVGAGGNDTGGANAFGEWLAGNDPDEVQRVKRGLREGTLLDPTVWPGGVEIRVSKPAGVVTTLVMQAADASGLTLRQRNEDSANQLSEVLQIGSADFATYREFTIETDRFGQQPLQFAPIPVERAPSESEQPILYDLDLANPAAGSAESAADAETPSADEAESGTGG